MKPNEFECCYYYCNKEEDKAKRDEYFDKMCKCAKCFEEKKIVIEKMDKCDVRRLDCTLSLLNMATTFEQFESVCCLFEELPYFAVITYASKMYDLAKDDAQKRKAAKYLFKDN